MKYLPIYTFTNLLYYIYLLIFYSIDLSQMQVILPGPWSGFDIPLGHLCTLAIFGCDRGKIRSTEPSNFAVTENCPQQDGKFFRKERWKPTTWRIIPG